MAKKKLKKQVKILIGVLAGFGTILIVLSLIYLFLTTPVDKSSDAIIEVTIDSGMSSKEIASLLKERELIRSEFIFIIESKLMGKTLKASTYDLSKNMSLKKIIRSISDGNTYNPNAVKITFKEGISLNKYALEIATNTNHTYEDVIAVLEDDSYIDELINKYWFLTDEIKNENIYYSLEGYLYPETYEFENMDVDIKYIIETMLDQTDKELSKYKDSISSSNRSVHELLTLASMVELEGTNSENRKMIAGVFYNRLEYNMTLGSDVTTYYALQIEMTRDLTTAEFATDNLYNTRSANMRGKLPVGPICNPGNDSIDAAINPKKSDYLYFVADKDGKVYYTKNSKEHEEKVNELKKAGKWIW